MKKFLAIIILTFMLTTLLTGCGGKDNEANNNNHSDDVTNSPSDGNKDTTTPDDQTNDTASKPNVDDENQNEIDKSEGSSDVTDTPDDVTKPDDVTTPDDVTKPDDDAKPDDEAKPEEVTPPIGTSAGYSFKDVTLSRVDGGVVNTADYRGKIIILNLWATWCPPCKAELPDFSRVASEYSDDVVVIAAHVPSGSASAKSYIESNLSGSEIIFAYDPYYEAYLAAGGVESIPQTAIINQNGVIIYSGAGMLSYEFLAQIIESKK